MAHFVVKDDNDIIRSIKYSHTRVYVFEVRTQDKRKANGKLFSPQY